MIEELKDLQEWSVLSSRLGSELASLHQMVLRMGPLSRSVHHRLLQRPCRQPKVTRTDIELVWFFRLWGLYDMVGEKKVDYVGWFDPTVPLSSKLDSWWGHAPDTDFLVYT